MIYDINYPGMNDIFIAGVLRPKSKGPNMLSWDPTVPWGSKQTKERVSGPPWEIYALRYAFHLEVLV